jgi:hypothetical protein
LSNIDNIPAELRDRPQWVLWKRIERDGKPTKVPFSAAGRAASTVNPATWATFDDVVAAIRTDKSYSGVGYVFAKDDPFVGVDLDDCRDPASGTIKPWAEKLIAELDTYAEISPSKTGVKLWCKATLPTDQTGKRTNYEDGQIELYQSGRYFAVTGQAVSSRPIAHCQAAIGLLWSRLFGKPTETTPQPNSTTSIFSDIDAAWAKLETLPDSVAGDRGHDRMLAACCEILRHGVAGDDAWELIEKFNAEKCDPPWSRHELEHKWKSAQEKVLRGREFGVLSSNPDLGRSFRLGLIEYHDFLTMDFPQRYLVKGIVAQGEHLVIGGPKKALKTSLALDLMISLASGCDFLGHFPVERQVAVAFVSGESGRATLQRAARRMARARGVTMPRGKWFIGFELPQIANAEHLAEIQAAVEENQIGFLAVDPAYLATLEGRKADSAGNVFAMGPILKGFGDIGNRTGCTMALIHHTRKLGPKERYRPLDLDDLSQSGFAEWARQWLLISRRHSYKSGTGDHALYLSVGGSAGHSGCYTLDVSEGRDDDPLGVGRRWEVTTKEHDDGPKGEDKPAELEADASLIMSNLLFAKGDGLAPSKLRETLKVSKTRIDAAVAHLAKRGDIDVTDGRNGGKRIVARVSIFD